MLNSVQAKVLYKKIQKQLFEMIPEKWSKVYLYSSIIENQNNSQSGEMFFYYYPKSILKKNPINVYEVPAKFNIDEEEYLKLADNLYNTIKQLKQLFINKEQDIWTNITILVENFKFKVIYNYNDLINTEYNNYERHIIWRYKYLKTPLETYNKKERDIIKKYLEKFDSENTKIYEEAIYKSGYQNMIEYNIQQKKNDIIQEEKIEQKEIEKEEISTIRNQILLKGR